MFAFCEAIEKRDETVQISK